MVSKTSHVWSKYDKPGMVKVRLARYGQSKISQVWSKLDKPGMVKVRYARYVQSNIIEWSK